MAKSKGRIHDVYNRVITELASHAAINAAASRGNGNRVWDVPSDAPDMLNIAGTTEAFDRNAVGDNFADVIAAAADPGTIGDVVSLKVQNDYVGITERGYRSRHCSPPRLIGMMLARHTGHGSDAGTFLGSVMRCAQDALKAGQS